MARAIFHRKHMKIFQLEKMWHVLHFGDSIPVPELLARQAAPYMVGLPLHKDEFGGRKYAIILHRKNPGAAGKRGEYTFVSGRRSDFSISSRSHRFGGGFDRIPPG